MMLKNLTRRHLEVIPVPPARFNPEDWHYDLRSKYRMIEDKQQLSDRVIGDSGKVIDETAEISVSNKKESDYRIDEKLKDIEFWKKELEKQRAALMEGLEVVAVRRDELIKPMQRYTLIDLPACVRCLVFREGRLGIDLVHDDVERELQLERKLIESVIAMLKRCLEQAIEQIRLLKSRIYFLDKDIEDKEVAIALDKRNLTLNNDCLDLSLYQGCLPLDPGVITPAEWIEFTNNNILSAAKELNSARQLCSYFVSLLDQTANDMKNEYELVNGALVRRIDEYKEAKLKFEMRHAETYRQANEMTLNIAKLELALSEKQGFLALAHTRLGRRAQRPNVELVNDQAQQKLMLEVRDCIYSIGRLQEKISEAKATLRYLNHSLIQTEEDINIKTNSIKIDELDVLLGVRTSMSNYTF